jgi:hypothetical protein
MDDLTYVAVGTDRFAAELIAEACRAAGFEVKLLMSDDSGYGPLQSHRLLVHSDQLEQVMALVDKSSGVYHPDSPAAD